MTKKSAISTKIQPSRKRAPKFKDPMILAKASRTKRLIDLRKRDRLLPCIVEYDAVVEKLTLENNPNPLETAMSFLTEIFRGTYQTILTQIGKSGKTGIGASNAVKRSAGTNFQGLCEYAVLRWLEDTNLPVSVGPNAPKSMKDELTIHGTDADSGDFSVEPDIDISLWIPNDDPSSPVIFLSAKTSLVDRAGQAARWKLYLDIHQTTCQHTKTVHDCPIRRTRVKVKTLHPITHCIVTANIYKIDTTQPGGELTSGQCRNNTYMFRHKFSTRNDAIEVRPFSWDSFSKFPELVQSVFGDYLMATARNSVSIRLVPIAP